MTGQRRLIARVLSESTDHPDVETLLRRAARLDSNISIATVYRTVHLFEEVGVLERHAFRDGKARYEERPESHHDHLIDMRSGAVVEFKNEAIEKMQERVAGELGYKLIGFAAAVGNGHEDLGLVRLRREAPDMPNGNLADLEGMRQSGTRGDD